MSQRVSVATNRTRMELTIYVLQLFCQHVDFSSPLPYELLCDVLIAFPISWLRPNCFSYQLLQHQLGGGRQDDAVEESETKGSWMRRHLTVAIQQHFTQIQQLADSAAHKRDKDDDTQVQRMKR